MHVMVLGPYETFTSGTSRYLATWGLVTLSGLRQLKCPQGLMFLLQVEDLAFRGCRISRMVQGVLRSGLRV